MPRHRIEREPRHRAQRPTRKGGRRVQVFAVPSRPPPGHAKPPDGPSASDRLAAMGAKYGPYQRRLLTGAARGLLVSPWFAAGAGFVIAAGAFIYAPHANLDFGNATGVTQCKLAQCTQLTPAGGATPPQVAGGTNGQVAASPSPAATTRLTFRYTVNWSSNGAFQMVLTVRGKRAIGAWQLAFVIPGAEHVSVVGAAWQPSGINGGTASGTTAGTGYQGRHAAPGAGEQANGGNDNQADGANDSGSNGANPDVIQVIVNGQGQPNAPAGCFFNGAQCEFSRN